MMHDSIVPLPDSLPSVMLAMEWDGDDITSNWYYKTDGNWSKYSSFVSPKIENPYYNLGVIWVGNLFLNHDGNAYFSKPACPLQARNYNTDKSSLTALRITMFRMGKNIARLWQQSSEEIRTGRCCGSGACRTMTQGLKCRGQP